MTQPQAVAAKTCNQFLRPGREFLAQGDLSSASAAGWSAAMLTLAAYAGDAVAECDFKDAGRTLVKEQRGCAKAAEWVRSAITLSENIADDWLDAAGVARRLDDVQRLALLVQDIADPPGNAEDILARGRECLDNGCLTVASEKGWEAALLATRPCADSMGLNYSGDDHFDLVTRLLEKDNSVGKEIAGCAYGAELLRRNGSYSALRPRRLYSQIIAEDIDGVGQLAAALDQLIARGYKASGLANV